MFLRPWLKLDSYIIQNNVQIKRGINKSARALHLKTPAAYLLRTVMTHQVLRISLHHDVCHTGRRGCNHVFLWRIPSHSTAFGSRFLFILCLREEEHGPSLYGYSTTYSTYKYEHIRRGKNIHSARPDKRVLASRAPNLEHGILGCGPRIRAYAVTDVVRSFVSAHPRPRGRKQSKSYAQYTSSMQQHFTKYRRVLPTLICVS